MTESGLPLVNFFRRHYLLTYRAARKIALKRAGHRCERCGTKERLTTHHIIRRGDAPSLICCSDNLKVLCRGCHKTVERRIKDDLRRAHINRHCPFGWLMVKPIILSVGIPLKIRPCL